MEPILTLLNRGAAANLPNELKHRYGGSLSFPEVSDRPYVIGNFVSTLDGVVSFSIPGKSGGGEISGFNEQDHFIMALLRNCADAILVGSGTLHGVTGHIWTPEFIFPALKEVFRDIRMRAGKSPLPLNVVITGSGKVDFQEPVFHMQDPKALVITTASGLSLLRQGLPPSVVAEAVSGERTPHPSAILDLLYQAFGVRLLLVEGGPHVFADFLQDGLIDEIFLTIAPQVAGRSQDSPRLGFAEGKSFLPEKAPWFTLVSVKGCDDHLYLRYRKETGVHCGPEGIPEC